MTRLPWVATALAVLGGGGFVVIAAISVAELGPRAPGAELAVGAVGIVTAVLGCIVAWRVRANVVGTLLVVVGVGALYIGARQAWYALIAGLPDRFGAPTLVLALNREAAVWVFVAVAALLVYFPSGRLPSPRWRWLLAALVATAALHHLAGFVDSSPYPPPLGDAHPRLFATPIPVVETISGVAIVLLMAALLTSVAMSLARIRRASGTVRAQLKWVALAGCLFLVFPFVCLADILLTGSPGWPSAVFAVVALLALPVGVVIGMLQHDLYDVDRAVASTVSYALLVLTVGTLFAGVAFGVGAIVGSGSPIAAAAATAAAALALAPAHRFIRRIVDSRLYPLRRMALQAIDQLQRSVNLGDAPPEQLGRVLSDAVRDPSLRVGYLGPGSSHFVDSEGVEVPSHPGSEVIVAGESAGIIVSRQLSPTLRRQIAAGSAALVAVVRLRIQLTASLREVEASRARILLADDEARRRLERDLHDGAQQRLVSLGMSLRLAQRHLADEGTDMNGLIDQTVAELTTAIAELRRLAHGIRPSALDEGLHAALTSLARSVPLPVELDVAADDVPEPIATTVFYVVSESLANVVKHAEADTIAVSVIREPTSIRVTVTDDGQGGASPRWGGGLTGLRDRVTTQGGTLSLSSSTTGTTVRAELPCAS